MRLTELADGWGTVEPAEGAGALKPYFKAHRLCDANTLLLDETWEPLRRNPRIEEDEFSPPTKPGGDPDPGWREKLLAEANRIAERGIPGADIASVQATISALPNSRIPKYLQAQLPAFFEQFPNGSFWFIEVDHLLVRRFAMMRAQLALELTPDVIQPGPGKMPHLDALGAHSISQGVHFGDVFEPCLLTFSPGALGFAFEWMPHALIFIYGIAGNLSEPYPPSFVSLYEPTIQSSFDLKWLDADFFEGVTGGEAEPLLQWWTHRMNVIYSFIADPTGFQNELGRHEPWHQMGWFLTFERMLADMLLIQTGFQRPSLARQQAAFDLLDKIETLLNFGSDETGKGFERLLRRKSMEKLLDNAWDRLPVQLRPRFQKHTRRLLDDIYSDIRANVLAPRLTNTGVRVGRESDGRLTHMTMESYVPALVRAVRNSAHGLIQQLERRDRFLVATHNGQLPNQLGDYAVLLAFALIADAEKLFGGTWLPDP